MQRRGYLARQPDPDDRRARLLELSDRGTAALAAAHAFHHRYERGLVMKALLALAVVAVVVVLRILYFT